MNETRDRWITVKCKHCDGVDLVRVHAFYLNHRLVLQPTQTRQIEGEKSEWLKF